MPLATGWRAWMPAPTTTWSSPSTPASCWPACARWSAAAPAAATQLIRHKDVTLDPATREATLAGRPVALSAREWAVLEPMLLRPGVVFSRAQLEEKLYGWKEDISSNAVEVYVHGVRKKLGAALIQTVRGLGYVVPRE